MVTESERLQLVTAAAGKQCTDIIALLSRVLLLSSFPPQEEKKIWHKRQAAWTLLTSQGVQAGEARYALEA